jgi:hypothetical protein
MTPAVIVGSLWADRVTHHVCRVVIYSTTADTVTVDLLDGSHPVTISRASLLREYRAVHNAAL